MIGGGLPITVIELVGGAAPGIFALLLPPFEPEPENPDLLICVMTPVDV